MTTEDFIRRAKENHGDRYDYSLTEYVKSSEKVTIICPEHGEFRQAPGMHLHKSQNIGCPECGKWKSVKSRKKSLDFHLSKAKEVHNNFYSYPFTTYESVRDHKVEIVCPKHGSFYQSLDNHKRGKGCPTCRIDKANASRQLDLSDFLRKSKEVHGDRYDYSLVEYKKSDKKVKIICPKHGEFYQTPTSHWSGTGCMSCCSAAPLNTNKFIEKSKEVHNNKYDYSLVEYLSSSQQVSIICPHHGEYKQLASTHLQGGGCFDCAVDTRRNVDGFIERARDVHGDKYDYSKVNYTDAKSKVTITCIEHGDFEQAPEAHYKAGCPKCSKGCISNLELELLDYIKNVYSGNIITNDRTFIKPLEIDILLPDINLAIEFNGVYWHSEKFKDDNYHTNKLERVLNKDYRLLSIFEDEWLYHIELTKQHIRDAIEENMISNLSDVYYNNLIYTVDKSNDELIVYSNRRWSEGNELSRLGCEFEKTLNPSHTFVNQTVRLTRDDLIERDINESEFLKIWDCGYNVYKYKHNGLRTPK